MILLIPSLDFRRRGAGNWRPQPEEILTPCPQSFGTLVPKSPRGSVGSVGTCNTEQQQDKNPGQRASASLPVINPVSSDQVIRFLFYLKVKGLAACSYSVYLATLSFWGKAQGCPDFTSDFRIRKKIKGFKRQSHPEPDKHKITGG